MAGHSCQFVDCNWKRSNGHARVPILENRTDDLWRRKWAKKLRRRRVRGMARAREE